MNGGLRERSETFSCEDETITTVLEAPAIFECIEKCAQVHYLDSCNTAGGDMSRCIFPWSVPPLLDPSRLGRPRGIRFCSVPASEAGRACRRRILLDRVEELPM